MIIGIPMGIKAAVNQYGAYDYTVSIFAMIGLGGIILYESTLSYLGLGVPFPRAAWGSMIALADPSKGQEILAMYPNMWVPAGILIVVTVLGFSFIGDGLRDAFDPRMKR